VSSRRGLALISISVIAAAVAFAATYPRWHPAPVPAPAASSGTAAVNAAALPEASGVLPSLHPTPAPLSWTKLSVSQRTALAPFAREWDQFSDTRKRKWLKIAAQYPKMSLDEQIRLHQRMTEWVGMTADQRRIARENFQLSKAVPPQQREKAWAAYQQLPEDQKKKLAATGRKNHRPTVVSTPLTGKKEVKDLNPARHPADPVKVSAASAVAAPAATGGPHPSAARITTPIAASQTPAANPQRGEHSEQ
jgi:Protein of unknown function (DUF3106)